MTKLKNYLETPDACSYSLGTDPQRGYVGQADLGAEKGVVIWAFRGDDTELTPIFLSPLAVSFALRALIESLQTSWDALDQPNWSKYLQDAPVDMLRLTEWGM